MIPDFRRLAGEISVIENESAGYHPLMSSLKPAGNAPITGITGPPGAGKSTLLSGLLREMALPGKFIAVVAVDPTSPFHSGALLGDRIRLSAHYRNPGVFIRSVATRGALGGLPERISEIADLLRSYDFDHILIETVGVGQSEVDIAGFADTTVVILSPGGGDDIQSMKAGLLDIADVFVINKADAPGTDALEKLLEPIAALRNAPLLKTIATEGKGIRELAKIISQPPKQDIDRRALILAQKALRLAGSERKTSMTQKEMALEIKNMILEGGFRFHHYISGLTGPG